MLENTYLCPIYIEFMNNQPFETENINQLNVQAQPSKYKDIERD